MKMGINNKITAERFHQIKGGLASGLSDDEVMRRFQIRKTTLRYIQLSKTFYEYRLRTEKCTRRRKMPVVYGPTSGIAFEDYWSLRRKCAQRDCERCHSDESSERLTECGFWGLIALRVVAAVIMLGLIVILLTKLVF